MLLGADDGSELGMLLGDVRGLLLGAMMALSLVLNVLGVLLGANDGEELGVLPGEHEMHE